MISVMTSSPLAGAFALPTHAPPSQVPPVRLQSVSCSTKVHFGSPSTTAHSPGAS